MKTLAREGDAAEILQRVRRVRPDSTARWGRMSSHQMICHLNDSFHLMMGRKTASPTTGITSVLHRSVVKWIALYAPLQWPPGIPTRPEIDQLAGGTRPSEFQADVTELQTLLEAVPTCRCDGNVHPFFGRMSRSAWLRWGYLHTDHHLRQFGV